MLSGAARAAHDFATLARLRADIATADELLQDAQADGSRDELFNLRSFQLAIRTAYQNAIKSPNTTPEGK